jgi:hypothetical protein
MSEIPRGAIRFNTDSNKPELWDGSQWAEFQLSTPNLGRSVDTQPGARGLYAGGYAPSGSTSVNTITYVNISSTGDAQDFGDLTRSSNAGYVHQASTSSQTRGLWAGGFPMNTTIDFVTFSSTGNASDFGDLTQGRYGAGAVSNGTRAVWMGGNTVGNNTGIVNTTDYVTISSNGNAVDFGDTGGGNGINTQAALSDRIRGVSAGGGATPGNTENIYYITIATLGNSVDIGDLGEPNGNTLPMGVSNATRGLIAGGYTNPAFTSRIQYLTMSNLGDSTDFGDLTVARYGAGSTNSPTRGLFAGGANPSRDDTIDYVNIQTFGDAVDFGNLTATTWTCGGCSNAHGGL